MSRVVLSGSSSSETWLSGGGELGRLVREKDWSDTPLGPIASWPQSLKTTLGILLHSRHPMFIFWGPELVKIYNDAYRPITGDKHPWALGRRAPEVWPEIWSDIKPLVDRALAGDPTWSDDLLLFMERNGFPEEVYFTFSYSPVSDESGGVGGMFCACTETTAQVIGERRLRTLRDLAAATADARTVVEACRRSACALEANAADVPFALVYLASSDGTYRLASQAGGDMDDTSAPREIAPGSDAGAWPVSPVADSGMPQLVNSLGERFHRVPRGPWSEPPSSAMVLPLVDRGHQRSVGALVLGTSSRRPFDEEYREWFGLIAAQIGASISNARAAEDERKRAEALAEIDRAKTAFFSNVSHEFRTPLTLLIGPVEDALAEGRTLDRPTLELTHRNALRLLRMVNTLLDFSRLEAGRVTAQYEPVDLSALTADLASVFRAAVERAGLTFTVACEPLGEPVYVDREMWEKVVLNLLSNAFKFTFEGGITVALNRHERHAVLSVRDTGIGVASGELPHLFERFHRVRGARGRTHEGTGIGLSIVQELARLHGGQVAVASAPEEGTTFTVTVPFGRDHLPADRLSAPQRSSSVMRTARTWADDVEGWLPPSDAAGVFTGLRSESDFAPRLEGARIVLADDNADMREYVRRLLEPYWRVEVVGDGDAALEALRRESADLVLSDVMMPMRDDFGVLRAVREDPALRHIPVILLSARAGDEARVEGVQAGADDYLVKPFGARELIARVGAALELSRVRREGQERLAALNRDLRDRVAELETLLRVIPVGIAIALDRECRQIQVNPAFARTLGIPPQANASLTAPDGARPSNFRVLDAQGRQVPPEALPMQVAAREGRVIADTELEVVRQDGRAVRLLEFAVPLLDEAGASRGSIGAFVDITERRLAEARNHFLVRFDDAVRALRDPLSIMALATELLGDHMDVSRCVYAELEEDDEHFTVSREYREADASPSILGRWGLSTFGEAVAADLRGGQPVVIRDFFNDRPASAAVFGSLDIRATIVAPAMRDGRLCAMLAVYASAPRDWRPGDVELVQAAASRCWESIERARAVRALVESEERFRTMADHAPVMVWVTNVAGECTYLSRSWYEFTGQTPVSALKFGWLDVTHPEDRLPAERAFADANARREPFRIEYRLRRGDGEYRWMIDSAAPRFGPGGAFVGFVGSVIDIADRKELEANLRQTNRLKDEFLATLSHELRTPLNAMLGWTHMIRSGSLEKDVEARALASLERNVRAQAQLVEDLLDVSRIVSGKMQIRSERVELHRVIAAAIETVLPAALSRDIALQGQLHRDRPVTVLGDPDRLRQIVWNLLSNAVKFTPRGGRVEVELARVDSSARIVVRDSGQGIAPDFLPFVFDRFRQADGTTTRRHGGLGLGLAIVAHLTEAHGGTVSAASDGLGHGATFAVQFPLAGDAPRPRPRPRVRRRGKALRNTRILVVDDEADARDLLRVILENAGAEVADATSAGEALHRLHSEVFDLLVADVAMPGQDGLALVRAMREESGPARVTPAIAVTAYASVEEREAALKAGYGWHLAKPVEPDRLVVVASTAIQEHRRAGGTAGAGRGGPTDHPRETS